MGKRAGYRGEARTRQAREQGYAARSVFKLEEIDRRFGVLRSGGKVLDLGAAPGSWSQFAARKVGPSGLVVAVDLKPLSVQAPGVVVITGDAFELDREQVEELTEGRAPLFDVLVSDMAPATSGVALSDHVASVELCDRALVLARDWVCFGGHFVCKVFQGEDEPALRERLRASFSRVKAIRPRGSRAQSKEIFLVGLGRKHL